MTPSQSSCQGLLYRCQGLADGVLLLVSTHCTVSASYHLLRSVARNNGDQQIHINVTASLDHRRQQNIRNNHDTSDKHRYTGNEGLLGSYSVTYNRSRP